MSLCLFAFYSEIELSVPRILCYQEELDPEDICEGVPTSVLQPHPLTTPHVSFNLDRNTSNVVKTDKRKEPAFKLDYDKLHLANDMSPVEPEVDFQPDTSSIKPLSVKKHKDSSKIKKKHKKKLHSLNDDEDARKLEEFLGPDYISSISLRNEQEYDQLWSDLINQKWNKKEK